MKLKACLDVLLPSFSQFNKDVVREVMTYDWVLSID